mmetsp:Transcript_26214/g.56873  ORF Transcript_26214/g.56873 Transcript_26214/m.56873 type:complete len:609 (-) Transcript_26214:472-2298(-)|eukprot:CAMPEP_0118921672 /NCGR_PEP_ID=MMETSP1169-20130426/873_1 /TAXON_ID=36882 /ORGANISM="Pyramimonas obovata, Strain CCMP722" /LENGTH=608 /DNA_ID=CAMNT_0006862435 /DNA_START=40 /DNA_END=1866 /DNA_ORIENTATION=+
MADNMQNLHFEDMGPVQDDEMSEEEEEYNSYVAMKVGEKRFLTKDEGIEKELLVDSEDFEQPEKGDEVFVHYVGTLEDGTKFDSSRDRGDLFSFPLGQGRVIKGWDVGVATMKKGEKCILRCKPDYAYGARGSPPTIPPNATLVFEVELFHWKSIKDIMGDGGIIKTVVTKGEGYKKPQEDDEVTITYKATLPDGTTKEETEVTFPIQEGRLCPGMKDVLLTMQAKEAVSCVLKGAYTQADGSGLGLEAGGEVKLDLTLNKIISIEKVEADGSVTKKTLEEGEGWNRPNEGASVGVRLVGYLPDGTKFEETPEGELTRWVVDEEQQIAGLDKALMKMKEKEKALISIAAKHAFGAREMKRSLATVPPNTAVSYEVELVELEKAKEVYALKAGEKVAFAEEKKAEGNALFKLAKLPRALQKYTKALSAVDSDHDFDDAQKEKAAQMAVALNGNIAAVQLKLKDFAGAKAACTKVLEKDGANIKGLFRRAQAYAGLGDQEEAEADLKKLLEHEPNNRDARDLLKKVRAAIKEQFKKDKAVFGNMFAKLSAAGDLYEKSPEAPAQPEDPYLNDEGAAGDHGHSHGGVPCSGHHEHKAAEDAAEDEAAAATA